MRIKLSDFIAGYIECALWCGVLDERTTCPECDGEGCDDRYCHDGERNPSELLENYTADDLDEDNLTDDARVIVSRECRDFVAANISDLMGCGLDSVQCGHDFYLTRNRHGAGYWDRKSRGKYADQCLDRLTEASHVYGEQSLALHDDNTVSIL